MAKCYAVIFTDRWGEDYRAQEIWTDEVKAEQRAKELTDNYTDQSMSFGERNYFYVVQELPLNEPSTKGN